jgi:Fe-S-cluster formation regulator IscX/YfhJ
MIKMYIGLHVKYPLFLSDFNDPYIIQNFMKIRPVGAKLFHADGQTDRQTSGLTDMTKLIVAFRNFENAPENCESLRINS